MDEDPRPFKLMLRPNVAKQLDHIAADLKSSERNYQIGVGTIAARLLESLSAHPEMIEQLLAEYTRKAGATAKAFHADETSGKPNPKGRTARQG